MGISRKALLGFGLAIVTLTLIAIFFSYRLLEVPTGLTVDEAAFGYNAALLARSGRDQNDRFLPVFVMSIDGHDWRQPVTQYYLTGLFKIFGPSIFLLRFSSVLITVFSAVLLYFLAIKLFSFKWAVFSVFVFLTTPLVMIQSHMGLDNIMPIPFTIIWLWGIYQFIKTKQKKYLVISAISLGVNYYTYKAMRATIPVWYLASIIYLFIYHYQKNWLETFKKSFKDILVFTLGIFPFLAAVPVLNKIYPGAILGGHDPSFPSFYSALYPYLTSFDISFLYIMGDLTKYHSTQQHGMMLLASAPFFFAGLYYAVKRGGFWIFVLTCFFTAPLLFGLVGSVHRASRLMMIIPFYCLIAALGAKELWENKHKIYYRSGFIAIIFLMVINYADFVNYYWYTYNKFSENVFGNMSNYLSYEKLAQEAKARNLTPYVAEDIYKSDGESGHFFETIYFSEPNIRIPESETPPPGSILMSRRDEIPGMQALPNDTMYRLQIRE